MNTAHDGESRTSVINVEGEGSLHSAVVQELRKQQSLGDLKRLKVIARMTEGQVPPSQPVSHSAASAQSPDAVVIQAKELAREMEDRIRQVEKAAAKEEARLLEMQKYGEEKLRIGYAKLSVYKMKSVLSESDISLRRRYFRKLHAYLFAARTRKGLNNRSPSMAETLKYLLHSEMRSVKDELVSTIANNQLGSPTSTVITETDYYNGRGASFGFKSTSPSHASYRQHRPLHYTADSSTEDDQSARWERPPISPNSRRDRVAPRTPEHEHNFCMAPPNTLQSSGRLSDGCTKHPERRRLDLGGGGGDGRSPTKSPPEGSPSLFHFDNNNNNTSPTEVVASNISSTVPQQQHQHQQHSVCSVGRCSCSWMYEGRGNTLPNPSRCSLCSRCGDCSLSPSPVVVYCHCCQVPSQRVVISKYHHGNGSVRGSDSDGSKMRSGRGVALPSGHSSDYSHSHSHHSLDTYDTALSGGSGEYSDVPFHQTDSDRGRYITDTVSTHRVSSRPRKMRSKRMKAADNCERCLSPPPPTSTVRHSQHTRSSHIKNLLSAAGGDCFDTDLAKSRRPAKYLMVVVCHSSGGDTSALYSVEGKQLLQCAIRGSTRIPVVETILSLSRKWKVNLASCAVCVVTGADTKQKDVFDPRCLVDNRAISVWGARGMIAREGHCSTQNTNQTIISVTSTLLPPLRKNNPSGWCM